MLADRTVVGVSWVEGRGCHLMKAEGREVAAFCDALVADACAAHRDPASPDPCFALGMACAVDALACGRLDLADPLGAAAAAWADASDTEGEAPCRVTDAVRRYWEEP